jgi:SOS response regulatory protein OraA/RecX
VGKETSDAAIAGVFERSELRETVRQLARTRWSRYRRDEDARRRKKKVHDYLVRRGFPFDLIREALAEVAD